MNAEAILEAIKAYAKACGAAAKMSSTFERGEKRVAEDILTLIKGLERKKNENMR